MNDPRFSLVPAFQLPRPEGEDDMAERRRTLGVTSAFKAKRASDPVEPEKLSVGTESGNPPPTEEG